VTLAGQNHALASANEQLRVLNSPARPVKPFADALRDVGRFPLACATRHAGIVTSMPARTVAK
jgi:hypothetical protein